MASNNLVVQLGSKIDAQRMALESKIDVRNSKIDAQWLALNSKIDAQNSKIDAQNSKIDAQNSKYNLLIALVSAGLTLAIAVGGWLLATAAG